MDSKNKAFEFSIETIASELTSGKRNDVIDFWKGVFERKNTHDKQDILSLAIIRYPDFESHFKNILSLP